mgnify:CR=1 FL=1
MTDTANFVTLTPLGGLGEIGLNCMTLATPGGMARAVASTGGKAEGVARAVVGVGRRRIARRSR